MDKLELKTPKVMTQWAGTGLKVEARVSFLISRAAFNYRVTPRKLRSCTKSIIVA